MTITISTMKETPPPVIKFSDVCKTPILYWARMETTHGLSFREEATQQWDMYLVI